MGFVGMVTNGNTFMTKHDIVYWNIYTVEYAICIYMLLLKDWEMFDVLNLAG